MKIANEFTVSAPIEKAWDVLIDLEQVIPLMPGAQMTGHDGDDVLGKVKVKVGPVTSEFNGKVHFVERDREQRRAVIDAKGKESRGTGNAAATVTAVLHEAGDRTRVTVDTDLKIVGKLAQFGSGMLQQVSEKLLGQFVESLEAKLAAENAPATPRSTPADTAPMPRHLRRGWSRSAAAEPAPIDLLDLAGGDRAEEVRPDGVRRIRGGRRALHPRPAERWPGECAAIADEFAVSGPLLFRGVDRAALAVALVAKLRGAGVVVSASGPAGFVAALGRLSPRSRSELYWAARLTLVNRAEDLPTFDAVISAVFDDAVLGLDPPSLKSSLGGAVASVPGLSRAQGTTLDGAGLPWTTRPMSITAADCDAGRDRRQRARRAAQPVGRPCRRRVRNLRRRRSAPHRQLARAGRPRTGRVGAACGGSRAGTGRESTCATPCVPRGPPAGRRCGWSDRTAVIARVGWSCCATSAGPCSPTPRSTCT